MGVYAKGYEIPKSCSRCGLRKLYQYMKPCPCPAVSSSLVANTSDAIQRRDGCPLVEVKEPHGDLTDMDELLTFNIFDPEREEYYQENMTIQESLALWAEKMPPTVIEAEGEHENGD